MKRIRFMEFSKQLRIVIPIFIVVYVIVFGLISVLFIIHPLNPLIIFMFASFILILIILIYFIPKKYISDIKVENDKIRILQLSKEYNIARKNIKSVINHNGEIEIELSNSLVVIPIGDLVILNNFLTDLKEKEYPVSKLKIQNTNYYQKTFSNKLKIMIKSYIGMIICSLLYGFASFNLLDYIDMGLLTTIYISIIVVLAIISTIAIILYVKEKRESIKVQ